MTEERDGLETVKTSERQDAARAVGERRTSLLVYHRDGAEIVQLEPNESIVVGRLPPSNVVVGDVALSRQHARFTMLGDWVFVEDLGSTNGTFVAGERIESVKVRHGQEITLGSVVVTIHELSAETSLVRGLAGHDRFLAAVEDEVTRTRYFGRATSVLMVRARRDDASAGHPSTGHVRFWCARLQALLRPMDRVGVYSDDCLEILFPEATADHAARVAQEILGQHTAEPPLLCGVASYPDSASSAEELIELSRHAAQRATAAAPLQTAQPKSALDAPSSRPSLEQTSNSRAVRAVLATAARIAKGALPILITGETGSGKEVLARFIHDLSARRERSMLSVNCGAIPAQLVESTLFGHEKGAFTGAHREREGVFEAADGGTIFLDEIGELPAPVQVALLRVLETKTFARVGSTKETTVDVRVIAATHRDLEAMVRAGRFREDLLYRLNTVVLRMPALRDRTEDIPVLSTSFLAPARALNGGGPSSIDPEAMRFLQAYAWPGNVRELRNVIERAVAIATGDAIAVDDLPERVRSAPVPTQEEADPEPRVAVETTRGDVTLSALVAGDDDFRTKMERVEAFVIEEALEQCGWHQAVTARRLGMPLRTFAYKLKIHGIRRPRKASR